MLAAASPSPYSALNFGSSRVYMRVETTLAQHFKKACGEQATCQCSFPPMLMDLPALAVVQVVSFF